MGNKRSKTQNPAILTNPEIAFLESKTGLSRNDIQAWHSQFLQDNPSGYIDLKHFERIYKELFPNGNASQTAKLAFKAFDTDNTGKITFSEFLIATAVPQTDDITYETKEQIEQLFELYDTNGDGYIDRREMKYFLEALCQSEGRSTARVNDEINRVFREFDYNRDNRLSKNETIDFILSRPF